MYCELLSINPQFYGSKIMQFFLRFVPHLPLSLFKLYYYIILDLLVMNLYT